MIIEILVEFGFDDSVIPENLLIEDVYVCVSLLLALAILSATCRERVKVKHTHAQII